MKVIFLQDADIAFSKLLSYKHACAHCHISSKYNTFCLKDESLIEPFSVDYSFVVIKLLKLTLSCLVLYNIAFCYFAVLDFHKNSSSLILWELFEKKDLDGFQIHSLSLNLGEQTSLIGK